MLSFQCLCVESRRSGLCQLAVLGIGARTLLDPPSILRASARSSQIMAPHNLSTYVLKEVGLPEVSHRWCGNSVPWHACGGWVLRQLLPHSGQHAACEQL